MEQYLTVSEVAKKMQYHPKTILNWIHSGRIMAFKVGKGPKARYRISETELIRIAAIGYEENMEVLKEQFKEE